MRRLLARFCWFVACECAELSKQYSELCEKWALRAHKYAMPKREMQDYLERRLQPVSADVEDELQRQREWEKSHR